MYVCLYIVVIMHANKALNDNGHLLWNSSFITLCGNWKYHYKLQYIKIYVYRDTYQKICDENDVHTVIQQLNPWIQSRSIFADSRGANWQEREISCTIKDCSDANFGWCSTQTHFPSSSLHQGYLTFSNPCGLSENHVKFTASYHKPATLWMLLDFSGFEILWKAAIKLYTWRILQWRTGAIFTLSSKKNWFEIYSAEWFAQTCSRFGCTNGSWIIFLWNCIYQIVLYMELIIAVHEIKVLKWIQAKTIWILVPYNMIA